VVRIRRSLIIRQVAGGAGGGQTLELADGRALVAILALHGRVGAQEWKTILVIIDLLYGNLPALNSVTLRAVRSHFPLVNIGVTILAILADVGEYGLGVALRAWHLFMHTAERIPGLIVVEFRNCADRPPAQSRMAILTGYGERAVRITGGLPLGGGSRNRGW
jgi:hypothetical protein